MRKDPYSGYEFFELIKSKLVEQQQLPVILDYGIPDSDAKLFTLSDSEFEVKMDVHYGGSEGIYVSIYIEVYYAERTERYNVGTFKTLHESEEAFRQMAILGANFILAAREYVRNNMLEFEWIGFYLKAEPKKEDLPKMGGLFLYDIQDAFQRKLDWKRKYPDYDVTLLKLETREYV